MNLKRIIQKAINEIDAEKVINNYVSMAYHLLSEEYGTDFDEFDVTMLTKFLFQQEENIVVNEYIFYSRPTSRSC